jgi:hypothetical protein
VTVHLTQASQGRPADTTGYAVGGTWEEPIVILDSSWDCPSGPMTIHPNEGSAVPSPSATAATKVP